MRHIFILLLLVSFSSLAQLDDRFPPLPDYFDNMRLVAGIASTPNPNFGEILELENQVVWKHDTYIAPQENIEIIETGAFLLMGDSWYHRATFEARKTKKLFKTPKLNLKSGDTITYKKNWRYDSNSNTGWNFWYFIGLDDNGKKVYGYDVLETRGISESGEQLLLIKSDSSSVQWTGKAGDSDYALTGTIPVFNGQVLLEGKKIKRLSVSMHVAQMDHEIPALVQHLKSADFFETDKHPYATFKSDSIQYTPEGVFAYGELEIKGIKHKESMTFIPIIDDQWSTISFDLVIDRTKYGVLYASSKQPDDQYSIDDTFRLFGSMKFQMDYPGARAWNTFQK